MSPFHILDHQKSDCLATDGVVRRKVKTSSAHVFLDKAGPLNEGLVAVS